MDQIDKNSSGPIDPFGTFTNHPYRYSRKPYENFHETNLFALVNISKYLNHFRIFNIYTRVVCSTFRLVMSNVKKNLFVYSVSMLENAGNFSLWKFSLIWKSSLRKSCAFPHATVFLENWANVIYLKAKWIDKLVTSLLLWLWCISRVKVG